MNKLPLKITFISSVFITIGTYSFPSSHAMNSMDNVEDAHHQHVSICSIVQDGMEEYKRRSFKNAQSYFERALGFLQAQIRGETPNADFSGKVPTGTVTFSPGKAMKQNYYYNSETFSLEKNAASLTKLIADCIKHLQQLHSAAQSLSDEE